MITCETCGVPVWPQDEPKHAEWHKTLADVVQKHADAINQHADVVKQLADRWDMLVAVLPELLEVLVELAEDVTGEKAPPEVMEALARMRESVGPKVEV